VCKNYDTTEIKMKNRYLKGLKKNFIGKVNHTFIQELFKYIVESKSFAIFFDNDFESSALIGYLINKTLEIHKKELRKLNNQEKSILIENIYTTLFKWFNRNKVMLGKYIRKNIIKNPKNYLIEVEKRFEEQTHTIQVLDKFEIKQIITQRIIEPDIMVFNKNITKDVHIIEIKYKIKYNDKNFIKKLKRQLLSYFELLKFDSFKYYKYKNIYIFEIKTAQFYKISYKQLIRGELF
jgi:hypothetical protein